MLEHLVRARVFSLDTETTGLDWTDRAFAVTVSTREKDFYFEDIRLIKHLFHLPMEVIMINAKFDMRMIELPFYSPWTIRDIGILGRILSNDEISIKAYSLDNLAKKYLGKEKDDRVEIYIKAYKCTEDRYTKYTKERYTNKRYDRVERSILQEYAMKDSRLTFDLYSTMLEKADEDDRRVFDNECDLLHATYKMEMEGIKLNEEYAELALQEESQNLQKTKEDFLTTTGVKYENKKSVLIPLFEKGGESISYTPKGNPRLTDDDLESFTSPAARLVQKIRYHEKRISTYYTSYLDLVDDKGFIHPEIIQHGTATGRFSYKNPNLQNCVKDEPEENKYTVRGCFVPSKKDNIFLSLDYSQQEYRLLLDYAKELKIIKEVMSGKDVHQAVADMVKISRKKAKTLNFMILYSGGIDKIAKTLDISVQDAKILKENYFLAMPGVDKLISDVIAASRRRGYVKNWFGRKLRSQYDFSYTAPNHLIQGGCGDIIKVAMVKIHESLKNTGIIMRLQVHDQLVFEGNKDEIQYNIKSIKALMEEAYMSKNNIILYTDTSYSEKSFAERDMCKWK
ncbi:MAG: hypothetical protein IPI17_02075 [Nitrosomonas sp.]|nr:hypothetical protein [Nitrosomonas sp.]